MYISIKNRFADFRQKMRIEREKLKEMNLREKFEYIKEYYFWHIIFSVVALIIIITGIYAALNPPPQTFVNVTFYGNSVERDARERIEYDLTVRFIEDIDHYRISTLNFFAQTGDPEFNLAQLNFFTAEVTAAQIDIIITHPDDFTSLVANYFAMDLREIFNEQEMQNMQNIIEYAHLVDFDALELTVTHIHEDAPFGLSLRNSSYMQGIDAGFANWILVVVPNTQRMPAVRQIIDFIIEY